MPTRSDYIREIEAIVPLTERERQGLRVINLFRLGEIVAVVRRAAGQDGPPDSSASQLREAQEVIDCVNGVVDAHRDSPVKSVQQLLAELDEVLGAK